MKREKKEHNGLFKRIREYWKIPRYRALIKLGLYIFFFVIVLLYIRIMNLLSTRVESTPEVNAMVTFATMDNYEYYYEINSGISSYTISGIRYGNQDNFRIGNDSFYVENNVIYSVDGLKDITNIIPIDLVLLRPERMYQFLQSSTDANKIEYQNGESKVTYIIPVTEFNIIFLQEIDLSNTDVVEVTTYEKNHQIYKLDLNIYNLMKLLDPTLESYSIQITYDNINNIKSVEELK